MSRKISSQIALIPLLLMSSLSIVYGQNHTLGYIPVDSRMPGDGVIEITEPGNYEESGATYMLTRDLSNTKSAIFLGKNVTLDLNGHTITYADGGYEQIPNFGFEEGLKGWDISNAPGAEVVNTKEVHVFIGDKLMSLQKDDEIVSEYIHLPIPNRSYFAMVGVTGRYYSDMDGNLDNDMKVSIYVEDEEGNDVKVVTDYADTTMISSPVENKSTRLGGGFVFAHLNNLTAGKYRVRVKAETDCLIDEVDIRPAMDVGVGIVEKTHPFGHYDHLYEVQHSAFFDYTKDISSGTPLSGIPTVEGEGTVTIKNGTIKSGAVGVMSWGVQSTAENVKVILDNVKIESSGINATAVDVPFASITRSTFKLDNPFIINRHGSQFYGVDLRGDRASEVSYSEFYGGQGNLVFKGNYSSVHHNYFVNRQTVTNHYSVMAMGDSSKVYENLFEPEIGSGLEIYQHKGIEIFNNVFHIEAAPPSTEYHLSYSTNAIRIADYGAQKGDPNGSFGNKVYNNKFYITGKKYPDFPDYTPMASAIFYSASAGDDYFFGNEITIDQQDPDTDAMAWAYYIGNADGGEFHNNRITTNVPPIWIATSYQSAANIDLYRNRITKSSDATEDFIPIHLGYQHGSRLAENVTFRSNEFDNIPFGIHINDQNPHSYSVSWTLKLYIVDENKNAINNAEVSILDNNGVEIFKGITDQNGFLKTELLEYETNGTEKTTLSPFTIHVRDKEMEIEIDQNRELTFVVQN